MICLLEKSSTTPTFIKFLSQNLLCWVVVIMSGLRSLWFLLLHLILCCHQEGVTKLWTGLGPNVARNAIINAAELASYDQVKQTLLKLPGFSDNVVTHLLSGLGAGFIAVCVGSPVDVVKSRMMGSSSTAYKGTVDCFVQTLKNDGLMAFYKGFLPNFARIGSWNVVMFLTLEQTKKLFTKEVEA
jgi:solute carrier family 25 uncoupling protein 8/9